jgi:hypothetical protein
MPDQLKNSTKKTAVCSVLLAMIIVVEYLDSIIPVTQVYLLAVCGVIVWFITKQYGFYTGLVLFMSSCVLLFLLIPNKQKVLMFTLFFGLYSVMKYHLEAIKSVWMSYAARILFMNGLSVLLIVASAILLSERIIATIIQQPAYIIIFAVIILQLIFIVYDFGLSFCTRYLLRLIQAEKA